MNASLCCESGVCAARCVIVVQGKQGAAVMSGCSSAEMEWVVFDESVRFLGQFSH